MPAPLRRTTTLLLAALGLTAFPGFAQSFHPASDGVRVTDSDLTVEVTALRDDILRVREWRGHDEPEDASWAVVPAARKARVAVSPTATGFRTHALVVSIDKELRVTVRDLEGHTLQQQAEPILYDGTDFHLFMRLADDEHFFGLGDKVGPLDRRGMHFVDWNTDIGWSESTDPIYKSIPFFYSWQQGRVLGVLFDNTWRASFDFGRDREHEYSFGSTNGPATYYLMYGPEPKQTIEDYAWLTGHTPMPPLWTLGFQQSRFSYTPQSRVEEIARHFRDDHIPADALYLDIDYQQDHRPFTVDPQKFPSFEQMITDLKKENFHVVAITDLHIALLPNAGYKPYEEGEAQDRFVKAPNGKDFVGAVWPGPSVFPNYSEADTRAWWGTLYAAFVKDRLAGFWNDMNEPSVFDTPNKTMPDDTQHVLRGNEAFGFKDRVASHLEIHNVFGMLQTEGTYEGLRKLSPDTRPFVLTRASYAGGQRYSATWTGDNSSTWNHLRLTTPMLENLGLSGFAMAGADVGGFIGSPRMNLLTKWIEIGAFQPIDRDHTTAGSKDQEPWVGGSEQEAIRRKYIETRYKLMPYLYTTAETMARTGIPIVRPLFVEFPHDAADGHPIDLDAPGEFFFGPDLLVAPPQFPDEVDDYNVALMRGVWYDFWNGERLDRTQINPPAITITPTLATLPVYARGGSVIPEQPLVQSTMEKPDGPLTLRVYPDAANGCEGSLYQDDGVSYKFEHGDFLRMTAKCVAEAGGVTVQISPHQGSYPAWWNQIRVEMYGLAQQPAADTNGHPLAVQRNIERNAWDVLVTDQGKGTSIHFKL